MSGIHTPRGDDTARIASEFAARISTARRQLQQRMEASGLTTAHGWRIHEEMVNVPNGSAIRLRPVHRTETVDEGYEVVVELK